LELFRQAGRELDRLDRVIEGRVRNRLKELSLNPYDDRLSKPVKMAQGRRVARVGDWRIIYRVYESERIVFVMAIDHRSKIYP
jgi:mRNA interferase RelE/StbE